MINHFLLALTLGEHSKLIGCEKVVDLRDEHCLNAASPLDLQDCIAQQDNYNDAFVCKQAFLKVNRGPKELIMGGSDWDRASISVFGGKPVNKGNDNSCSKSSYDTALKLFMSIAIVILGISSILYYLILKPVYFVLNLCVQAILYLPKKLIKYIKDKYQDLVKDMNDGWYGKPKDDQ